jgi:hypothetical protein
MILASTMFAMLAVLQSAPAKPTPAKPTPAKPTPAARPAHIILIRHAEKPVDQSDPHLSPAGVTRAERLVSFIKTDPAMTALGTPVAIFATHTTKDGDGQRSQETVGPLGRALKLTVQTPVIGKDFAEIPKLLLENPAYAGKTVLICWNQEMIPALAGALGVKPKPPNWKAEVFDRVYVISYRDGKTELATYRY